MSTVDPEPLRAVVPANVSRRWNTIALRRLCEITASQAEAIEQLRNELIRADECAEHWREEAFRLHEELAEVSGRERGITPQANLVLAPRAEPAGEAGGSMTMSTSCEHGFFALERAAQLAAQALESASDALERAGDEHTRGFVRSALIELRAALPSAHADRIQNVNLDPTRPPCKEE